MSQITELLPKIFCVEIPEGAECFEVECFHLEGWYKLNFLLENLDEESGFYGEWVEHDIDLPAGNWSILFASKEAGEEDWKQIIVKIKGREKLKPYPDYEYNLSTCWTAKESGESLLSSKGLDTDKNYLVIRKNDLYELDRHL